jgi:hypothetical protein
VTYTDCAILCQVQSHPLLAIILILMFGFAIAQIK